MLERFSSLKCKRQDKLLLNNLESLNFLDSIWACFFVLFCMGMIFTYFCFTWIKHCQMYDFNFVCVHGLQLLLLSLSQDVCVK